MRIVMTAVAVALLAGCASMNEKRADGPAASFSSTKSVEKLSECVLFAWQNQSLAGVNYDVSLQPFRDNGKTVISAGQAEFGDFTPLPTGSKVDLYFMTGIFDWRKDRRIEAIKGCL